MKLTTISPQKAFVKQRPQTDEIKVFKENLLKLLGKVDEIESEENQNCANRKKEVKDSSEYEKQIDELVYQLYEITPEERAIIEGK